MDKQPVALTPVGPYDEHHACNTKHKENNMSTTRRPKAPRRQIPAHWKTLMDRKGLSSIRRLAEAAGLDHVSVNKVVFGDRPASEMVIQGIAKALEIDMKAAYRLMGNPVGHAEPWTPPAASARLDREQRRVLEDLIYVMVEGARPGMKPATSQTETTDTADVHPERDNLDLAADTSHGISQWQQWADDGA